MRRGEAATGGTRKAVMLVRPATDRVQVLSTVIDRASACDGLLRFSVAISNLRRLQQHIEQTWRLGYPPAYAWACSAHGCL
jgi:negative regulator of sigma E activity